MHSLLFCRIFTAQGRLHQLRCKEYRKVICPAQVKLPALNICLAHRAIGNKRFGSGPLCRRNNISDKHAGNIRTSHGQAPRAAFGSMRPGDSRSPDSTDYFFKRAGLLIISCVSNFWIPEGKTSVIAGDVHILQGLSGFIGYLFKD